MRSLPFALALVLGSLLWVPGCASDQPDDPNRVSSIPWNRPERWEGQGPLGSFRPGAGYGGSY